MSPEKKSQTMKAATAAKKLGIYLQAAPQEFQDRLVSRPELNELQADPPEWLVELRLNGPHPKPVSARKLNISIAGLARGGITEPLTTAQIDSLLADPPEWLIAERATAAKVREEARRLREEQARKDDSSQSRR